ncbi:MAG TPA: ABC transporter ATP-binding protein [Streptosporangiaceae bacterium]|jgi:ABC-type branched-subunit amino acid transport system ATPase component
MTAVLAASGVSVNFGSVQALADIDIEVPAGQLVGLIGPNGAGKTTFIDAVTGFVPAAGTVVFDGTDISAQPPHARARLGLARTWQTIELFDDLTVRENLVVAARRPTFASSFGEVIFGRGQRADVEADNAIRILELADDADRMPSELPQGKRKLVGVARALAGRSRLILLDEPASGLDPAESLDLGQRLRRVVNEGVSMLLVDHDMGLVLTICDHVYVLDFGHLLAHGAPESVRADPKVLAAYLGGVAGTGVIAAAGDGDGRPRPRGSDGGDAAAEVPVQRQGADQ